MNWIIEEKKIVFERDANKKLNFNSEEMISRMLDYSVELEKIAWLLDNSESYVKNLFVILLYNAFPWQFNYIIVGQISQISSKM